jgi:UDP-N-acetylmuramoyl-tripeptide--D-alanyl-D-alanine ligase
MCASVLRAREPITATAGNLNNLVGVPRTLLTIDPERTLLAVVEMGMNVPGEIAKLCEIARPDIGIVTNVAPVHTEGVGSVAGVAREKGALLTSLSEDGTAIYDADEPLLAPYVAASKARRKIGFGRHVDADVRIVSRTARADGQNVSYRIGGDTDLVVELSLLGAGAAKNAGAAIALARAVWDGAHLDVAARALGALKPEPGRLCPIAGPGNTVILDDSYNASPRSVINAIDTATEIARATNGRIVAVLGDMLELGAAAGEMHFAIGAEAARSGLDLLVLVGELTRAAAAGALESGIAPERVVHVADTEEALRLVPSLLASGDVVLVKGSRATGLDRLVKHLVDAENSKEHAA